MTPVFPGWWRARSTTERRLLVVVAACVGLVLYAWLLRNTMRARARLVPAVAQLQADARHQGEQADAILRLRAMPATPQSTMGLRELVQRQVDAGGLGKSLVSIERVDARQMKLVFGSVAFADWLAWAERMRVQQLRFVAVRIEAQATPGQVSVSATLERPAP